MMNFSMLDRDDFDLSWRVPVPVDASCRPLVRWHDLPMTTTDQLAYERALDARRRAKEHRVDDDLRRERARRLATAGV